MRYPRYFDMLFVVAVILSSCVSSDAITTPASAKTPFPSVTSIPATSTFTNNSMSSPTQEALATLHPEEVENTLRTLLREPVDCEAPCFWGIVPGQTTLEEAKEIFTHLNLQLNSTTENNKDFYGTAYDFDSGLSIRVIFTIQDELVENIRVKISPESNQAGVPREWLAYSPETLINRYGIPSRVDFFVGRGPRPSYAMTIYFDEMELITEYYSYDLGANLEICPLTDQFGSVRVWMGKAPVNPPPNGILLEESTSLTTEEFARMMTSNPDDACFSLDERAFP